MLCFIGCLLFLLIFFVGESDVAGYRCFVKNNLPDSTGN